MRCATGAPGTPISTQVTAGRAAACSTPSFTARQPCRGAAAGQRHVQRRGRGGHRRAHATACAGARQRRLLQARWRRSRQMMGRRAPACASPRTTGVRRARTRLRSDARHHPCGADPLRNRHRRAEPAAEVAAVCSRHGKGPDRRCHEFLPRCPSMRRMQGDPLRRALMRASGKCLEGVPGMGFVFMRKAILDGCAGQPEPGDGPARPAPVHGEDRPVALHAAHTTWWWRWPRPSTSSSRKKGAAGAPGALHRQLPHAGRRHGGTGLQALPRPGGAGADHRHLPHAPGDPTYDFKDLSTPRPRRAASSCIPAS